MLGHVARGGATQAAEAGVSAGGGGVRWQKERIRTAHFDAMAIDPDKVEAVRNHGGFGYAESRNAAYDGAMHGVVEHLLTKDNIVGGDSQQQRDEDYSALYRLYNEARQTTISLRDEQPAPAEAIIDRALETERELLGAMLAFETVKPPRPPPPPGGLAAESGATEEEEPRYKQHNFTHILNKVHLCYEKKQAQFLAAMRVPSLVDQIVNPVESTKSYVTGRERLNIIRQILDSFGLERSDMQKTFHEDMIGACAKLIFKDDLLAELDDLLLELGVDELMQQFMAITPRRFGKTYSVAMFVVALLFGVEGIEQAIFSTGRRASQKLIELVYRFMCKIPGMRQSIIKHNVETIWIQGPYGADDVRKVFSYPSNVRISYLRCVVPCVSWGVCLCIYVSLSVRPSSAMACACACTLVATPTGR